MALFRRSFLIAQCGYVVLVLLSLVLMPGASIALTLLAMVGVWIVVSAIYNCAPWKSEAGWWTLLIAATLLSIGIVANVNYFTVCNGGSTQLPILNNPDAFRFYHDALYTIGHSAGVAADMKNHGYGLLISFLWRISGVTIVAPLVLNMMFVLLAIIVSGGVTWRLLRGETPRNNQWTATCAMIMTSAVCYFLNSGTLLLKEAALIFAMATIGFALTALADMPQGKTKKVLTLAMFASGAVILSFLRLNFLIMVLLGIVAMLAWKRRNLVMGCAFLLICIVCWKITSTMLYQSDSETVRIAGSIMESKGLNTTFFLGVPDQEGYNSIISGYFGYPWWKKLLTLPMSAAVQYLIPLPWGFGDDIMFGYTLAYAHISYPWYIVGGLVLYFLFFELRKSPKQLRRMVVWAALMWLVPAYLFAGTVSRYALPLLPMLVPAAVYVVSRAKGCKYLKMWSVSYGVLLVLGLIGGYFVQKGVWL